MRDDLTSYHVIFLCEKQCAQILSNISVTTVNFFMMNHKNQPILIEHLVYLVIFKFKILRLFAYELALFMSLDYSCVHYPNILVSF